MAAVGQVTRTAEFSQRNSPATSHRSFLDVAWKELPRIKSFGYIAFPMHTLSELTEEKYLRLTIDTLLPPLVDEPDEDVEDQNAFVLEKYLEDFIVSNFDTIFKGQLRIYKDEDGEEGQQYLADDVGRIDILAIEPTSNSLVVIELKKGRSSDKVVGQVLRYMGWVKRNLCKEGQGVKGLIVCRDADPKMNYAIEMTKDVEVRYYKVTFMLNDSPSPSR